MKYVARWFAENCYQSGPGKLSAAMLTFSTLRRCRRDQGVSVVTDPSCSCPSIEPIYNVALRVCELSSASFDMSKPFSHADTTNQVRRVRANGS